MSERRCSPEDDCSSLLSRLGSDSPRPRMKYGGMFCNVEGAFENKTLNFESLGPRPQRCQAARTRSRDGGHATRRGGGEGGGRTVAFPSGHTRENCGKREDTYRSGDRALYKQTRSTRTKAAKRIYSQKLKELLSANDPALVEYILLQV